MTHGSLFSGIGGFDLAAQWMGWNNVFHCELEKFCQRVLRYYWPEAMSYGDIATTDFRPHRGGIDVLTGGFPCQPYSQAGKRLGKEDDRHLWPEMLRAIREIQPTWIVGENVLGLVNWNGGLVFEEVQADLETEGYQVQPYVLPAAGVNAPHQRYRVWFVAYRSNTGIEDVQRKRANPVHGSCLATNSEMCDKFRERACQEQSQRKIGRSDSISFRKGPSANTNNKRFGQQSGNTIPTSSTQYRGIFKEEGFESFPTQSPICSRDDGIPKQLDTVTFPKWRNESIKAAGNAIVPQVALQIFKSIHEYGKAS